MSEEKNTDPVRPPLSRRGFLRTVGAAAGLVILGSRTPAIRGEAGLPENPPVLTDADEKLLDKWQQHTLKYFTEYSPKDSGLALERSNWAEEKEYKGKAILATGATGFGIMALIAGAKRGKDEFRKGQASGKQPDVSGWPTDRSAREHIAKVVNFLDTKTTKYHGAFSHWIEPDGKTFSPPWAPAENGGDLLETSFLIMGLLTAREYFKDDPQAKDMCKTIDKIWNDVDWKWYTKNGKEDKLYWHYSPDREWEKNYPIQGWNEGLVTYVLAASAPNKDHRISRKVYEQGWAAPMKNRTPEERENVTALQYQYSMAGLDLRGLKDEHVEKGCADYWEQGKKHLQAMYKHCVDNPKGHKGYGPDCWGLSECDGAESVDPDRNKYQPRSITRDDGTIATAAGPGSIIYMPKEALATMRRFSEDKNIWDKCGPVDAFNLRADNGEPWYDRAKTSKPGEKGEPVYIGIHQLPIGVLIENHRSGLLWDLFMKCPEVQNGLENLGMSSPYLGKGAQHHSTESQRR